MDKDELSALWQRLKETEQISWNSADFLNYNTLFERHDGDLSIEGDFILRGGKSLIVDGDLTIEGTYDDCRGTGHIVVLGDMKADNVLTWGTSIVTGRLTAKELVYCCYNDHISEFRGGVTARALLISDKSCEYPRENNDIEFCLSDWGELDLSIFRHLVPALAPENMEDTVFPEYDICAQLIHDRKSIFRETPADAEVFDKAWARLTEDFYDGDLSDLVSVDVMIRAIIAQQHELPVAVQEKLLSYEETDVICNLAGNPATAPLNLAKIIEMEPLARAIALKNPNAPSSVSHKHFKDPNPKVRAALAGRTDITAEIAARLAVDPDPEVRRALVWSAGVHLLDQDRLLSLADDADVNVLISFMQSGVLFDHSTCAKLARHPHDSVRSFLASYIKQQALWLLPQSLTEKERHDIGQMLVADPKIWVSAAAVIAMSPETQYSIVKGWLETIETGARFPNWVEKIAQSTTSEPLMELFAKVPDIRTHQKLAGNKALSPKVQNLLFEQWTAHGETDGSSGDLTEVIKELASNIVTTDDVLVRIASTVEREGLNSRAFLGLKHCNNLPPAALDVLTSIVTDLEDKEDLALTIIGSPRAPQTMLKQAIALWYNRDENLLKEHASFTNLHKADYWAAMAGAESPELREIAASHHETPLDVLVSLMEDSRPRISGSAAVNQSLPIDHPKALEAFAKTKDTHGWARISETVLLHRYREECRKGTAYRGKDFLKNLSNRKLKALYQ